MTNFLRFASVTKKITLAIVGVFLMVFLLVHAGINLCLLRSDGGEWFRAAAHFMGTNYIIKVFEVVLFAAILLHLALAIFLQYQNWKARGPVGYKVSNKSATRPGSKFMIYTGILVAIFLGIHLCNFYFVKLNLIEGKYMVELKNVDKVDPSILEKNQDKIIQLFKDETAVNGFKLVAEDLTKEEVAYFGDNFKEVEPDFYSMAKSLFTNWLYVAIYIVLIIALGVHLRHAFGSAFQTIGWSHPKYTPFIEGFGLFYAVLIAAMFGIIPIWFLLA